MCGGWWGCLGWARLLSAVPAQLCLCPGRVSAARNVKVAPRLQPPVPSSDTQYSRVLQFWPPCTWYSQCSEKVHFSFALCIGFTLYESNTGLCTSLFSWNWEPFQQSVKSSSLLWIIWIKSCFADEGIVNKDEHQCQNGRTPQYRHHSSWPQHCTHLISLLNILMAGINPIQDVYQTFYILAVSLF